MMEDAWLCVEEDSSSSLYDSDAIDSETEAELYSIIHYEENLSNSNCHASGVKTVQDPELPVSISENNAFYAEKNRKMIDTTSVTSSILVCHSNVSNSITEKKVPNPTAYLNKLAQNLNSVRKKSSVADNKVSNIMHSDNLEDTSINQSLLDMTLNNKLKRKSDSSSSQDRNPKKNCKISFDSSDSNDDDSIIWTEVDSSVKKNVQTSSFKDLIYESSDSDSDIFPISKTREPILTNLSMPNMKIGVIPAGFQDDWFIKDEDLYRQRKSYLRRYHDVDISCSNCNRKGHNSHICPLQKMIKCFICGGGHHGTACVNRICGKCFNMGHDSKRCWMPCGNKCKLCGKLGHGRENCPDIWRRYHLTTKPGKIIKGKELKQDKLLYCWNCGQPGHYGAECKQFRKKQNRLSTWPNVVSYDNPNNLLKRRMIIYHNKCKKFKKDESLIQTCKSIEFKTVNGRTKRNNNKEKKKKKLNLQQCNNITPLREKDFPRTPKQNSFSDIFVDEVPESVKCLSSRKLKIKEKRRKRKLKRKQLLNENRQKLLMSQHLHSPK